MGLNNTIRNCKKSENSFFNLGNVYLNIDLYKHNLKVIFECKTYFRQHDLIINDETIIDKNNKLNRKLYNVYITDNPFYTHNQNEVFKIYGHVFINEVRLDKYIKNSKFLIKLL